MLAIRRGKVIRRAGGGRHGGRGQRDDRASINLIDREAPIGGAGGVAQRFGFRGAKSGKAGGARLDAIDDGVGSATLIFRIDSALASRASGAASWRRWRDERLARRVICWYGRGSVQWTLTGNCGLIIKGGQMMIRFVYRFLFLATASAASLAGPVRAQNIVAHRGASYDAPENTLAAMNLAWEQGADGVEADFYLTSDRQIICIHDPDTQRVAGVKHVVAETTFDDLRQLDVGAWKHEKYRGERMPTLKEIAATVPPGKLFVIELKTGPEIVAPLVEDLKEVDLKPEQMIIICFNPETITECERLLPQLKSYWLTDFQPQEDGSWKPSYDTVLATLESSHADGLGAKAEARVLDADFLKRLCDQSFCDFHVWTVDDAAVARRYQQLGAWGITTNRPGWLREQLQLTDQPR